jgi:hypothetical protein
MKEKEKSYYRWIEVTDFALAPRKHGEYSTSKDRIWGKAIRVKITPMVQKVFKNKSK